MFAQKNARNVAKKVVKHIDTSSETSIMTATAKAVGNRDKENKMVLAAKEALKEGGATTPIVRIGLDEQ